MILAFGIMKRHHKVPLLFYLVALKVLISCAPQPMLQPPQATAEVCAPATLIPIPLTQTSLPPPVLTHYFILIDRSGSYYATVDNVINLTEATLKPILRPGDKITIAWISSVSGKSTENIFDGFVPITLEHGNADPLSWAVPPDEPDLIEIPDPKPGTTMKEMQETATVEAIIRENQNRTNSYNCHVREWNRSLEEKIIPEETSIPDNQRQLFIEEVIRILEKAKLAPLSDATDIYGALWDVTQSFSVGRGTHQFQRFKLIIFSDLVDTENQKYLPINLLGVDVLVAWFECGDPKDCNTHQQHWNDIFASANANSVNYLRERESTTQNLVSLLLR